MNRAKYLNFLRNSQSRRIYQLRFQRTILICRDKHYRTPWAHLPLLSIIIISKTQVLLRLEDDFFRIIMDDLWPNSIWIFDFRHSVKMNAMGVTSRELISGPDLLRTFYSRHWHKRVRSCSGKHKMYFVELGTPSTFSTRLIEFYRNSIAEISPYLSNIELFHSVYYLIVDAAVCVCIELHLNDLRNAFAHFRLSISSGWMPHAVMTCNQRNALEELMRKMIFCEEKYLNWC